MFLLLFLSVTTSLLRGVVGFSERFKTTQTAIIGVTEIWEVQRDKPIFKDSTFFYFLLFFFAKFWFCFQNLAFLLLIYFSFSFWGLMRKRRSGWFKEEGVLAGLLGISLFFIAILVLRFWGEVGDWIMSDGYYSSKKTDDICDQVCGEVRACYA